jgi:hypothetical protein
MCGMTCGRLADVSKFEIDNTECHVPHWQRHVTHWQCHITHWQCHVPHWQRHITHWQRYVTHWQCDMSLVDSDTSLTDSDTSLTDSDTSLTHWQRHVTHLQRHVTRWQRHITHWQRHVTQWQRHVTHWQCHVTQLQPQCHVTDHLLSFLPPLILLPIQITYFKTHFLGKGQLKRAFVREKPLKNVVSGHLGILMVISLTPTPTKGQKLMETSKFSRSPTLSVVLMKYYSILQS